MKTQKKIHYCNCCVNPMGMGIVNPESHKELLFERLGNKYYCELCLNSVLAGDFPSRDYFSQSFHGYLQGKRKAIFAYSGGLDSTVVLALLLGKCRELKVDLQIFSVITGVKGEICRKNIAAVINFLDAEKNYSQVDISSVIQNGAAVVDSIGESAKTVDVYRKCLEKGIMPCGRICNQIIDAAYEAILKKEGLAELITGGDTPKKDSKGNYSLFWLKKSGITVVRGGYALGLSKVNNRLFVREKHIPWEDPGCGGYDTDCLVPGAFLAEELGGKRNLAVQETIVRYPIILEYLAERARFGIISRDSALRKLRNIDIANLSSYLELEKIFSLRERG